MPEGAALEAEWNAKFAEYEKKYPEEAAELKSIIKGELPAGWEKALPVSSSLKIGEKFFLQLHTYVFTVFSLFPCTLCICL